MKSTPTLETLDRFNWEECLSIELDETQKQFIPSILYSLAQAKFENLTPFGIRINNQIIGLMMYGQFGRMCWISRVMIDKQYQGKGIAKAAINQLIIQLKKKAQCQEIRTSYAKQNLAAQALFQSCGFHPINDVLEDEIVARYEA